MTRILVLSDTHNRHDQLNLHSEGIDILIHCGDATNRSTPQEFAAFAHWFNQLPHKRKVFIPGNHDYMLTGSNYYLVKQLFNETVDVLCDDLVEIDGISIFGASDRGCGNCPADIDILLTHYPAQGILDEVPPFSRFNSGAHPINLGNREIRDEIRERIYPKYHLFGHVHECGGEFEKVDDTIHINAAVLNEYYVMVRPLGFTFDFQR